MGTVRFFVTLLSLHFQICQFYNAQRNRNFKVSSKLSAMQGPPEGLPEGPAGFIIPSQITGHRRPKGRGLDLTSGLTETPRANRFPSHVVAAPSLTLV